MQEVKAWERLSEEDIKVGWRKLKRIVVRIPDVGEKEFVINNSTDTVCAFIVTADNKIVLARQFRLGPNTILDELPGGGMDPDETPEAAVKREVLEETGFKGEIISLGSSYFSAYSTRTSNHFLIKNAKQSQNPKNDPNEPIEVVIKSKKEFMEQLRLGKLTDSETAFRAFRELGW